MVKQEAPKTIKQIKAEKKAIPSEHLTIMNISKQMISIHLKSPPGIDFFIGAQDIRLRPNQNHSFDVARLNMNQINRLQKMGKISVA